MDMTVILNNGEEYELDRVVIRHGASVKVINTIRTIPYMGEKAPIIVYHDALC